MKTFIKWPGNKSRYVKQLAQYLPNHFDKYIEPFVGSGAFFLYLKPNNWVINDLNEDIMNVWSKLKTSYIFLLSYMKEYANDMMSMTKQEKVTMCRLKTDTIAKMKFSRTRAALYLVLKSCVYMGILIRKNKLYFRGLDMSMYANSLPYFVSEKYIQNLNDVNKYLKTSNGKISCGDYKKTLNKARKGDFVFLDPPYLEDHKYDFVYNIGENINKSFVIELFSEVQKLDVRGVMWMMTQADTPLIRRVFNKYNIGDFKVFRRQSQTHKTELIITNYIIPKT